MTPAWWACALLGVFTLTLTPAQCKLPRVFVPAPDFKHVALRIDSHACADQTAFLAVVLVISHPGNLGKRNAMRATYPSKEIGEIGFRRVFVVGTKEGVENNMRYPGRSSLSPAEESRLFGDLLQLDLEDTYDGLLVKTRNAFKWAVDRCAHARFVVKLDDDMVADFYTLAKVLGEVLDADVDAIRGRRYWNPGYLTPYISGGCYVTTPKTIRLLLEGSESTQPYMHYAEDAYFNGVLADKVGVARLDVAAIRHWEGAPHCCADKRSGVVYACQHAVFEDRRGMSHAHAQRFKAHGRFCYFFGCEGFTRTLIDKEGLTCFR